MDGMKAGYSFQLRKAIFKDFAEEKLIRRKSRKFHSFYSVFCHFNEMRSMEILLPDLENLEPNIATICSLGVTSLSKDYRLGNSPDHRAFLRRVLCKKEAKFMCFQILISTVTLLRRIIVLQMKKVERRNNK